MRSLLRPLLFLLGLAALVWLAWSARAELARLPGGFIPGWFALALLGGLVFTLAQGWTYTWLMRKHGSAAAPRELLGAFLFSQPGKYVPGRVWGPAMQIAQLHRTAENGAHVAGTFVANAELMVLAAGHSLGLGVTLALLDRPLLMLLVLAATLLASLIVIHQRWTAQILAQLGRRWTWLPPMSSLASVALPPLGLSTMLAVLLIVLNVAASTAVVLSQGGVPVEQVLPLLAAIYLGWTTGYLALPVPAGIGVREASAVAFAHWLVPEIATDTVVAVALVARLWQFGIDFLAVAAGALLNLRR